MSLIRNIPVPSEFLEAHARVGRAQRQVILPPSGDMLDENCRPADVLITFPTLNPGFEGQPVVRVYFVLDPEDLEAVRAGGNLFIEFSTWGDHLHPFCGVAYPENVPEEKAG